MRQTLFVCALVALALAACKRDDAGTRSMATAEEPERMDTISDWGNNDSKYGEEDPGFFYDTTIGAYKVYSAEGLRTWADIVNASAPKANCVLTADIDFEGRAWLPITVRYEGTFDGAGHTIRNVLSDSNYFFIAIAESGVVRDLKLEDIVLNGTSYNTGLITNANFGEIADCAVARSKVVASESSSYVGCVAGRNFGTIARCHVECELTGECYVGGITGYNVGTIIASSFEGKANGVWFGGIAALNPKVKDTYGTITACWADVAGDGYGIANKYHGGIISSCYWSGVSLGDQDRKIVGAMVDGTKTTWPSVVARMNEALPEDFGWQWTVAEANKKPILVEKNQS